MDETVLSNFPAIIGRSGVEAPTSKYEIASFLGSGSCGSAFLVNIRGDPTQRFVAKVTDLSQLSDRKKEYARSEIRCLAQCHHVGIVGHIEDHESPDGRLLLIIMEFADAGDLQKQISVRSKSGQFFKEHEVAFLFLQMLLAVDYLHCHRILHRDIKAANVFLTSKGTVKLGDLGFSQQYEDTVSNAVAGTFCGTPFYIAPEVWRSKRYSKKADVWSLGVLLYQMSALTQPFRGANMTELMDRIVAGRVEALPAAYANLEPVLQWVLTVDPNVRPSTRHILHHPHMLQTARSFVATVRASRLFSEEQKMTIITDVERVMAEPPAPTPDGPIATIGDIQPHLSKEGPVRHLGSSGWKSRYLKLADGQITVSVVRDGAAADSKTVALKHVSGVLPVSPAYVDGAVGVFVVEVVGGRSVLQAPTVPEADEWVEVLQRALGEG